MNKCNLYRPLLFVIAAQLTTQLIVSAETDDLCCEPCPYNWFPRKDKCFFISDDYVTFYEANEKCKSMRSTLAPVYSDEDQYLLVSVLADESKKCQSYEDCAEFWIGVFDAETRNIWTTTNGTSIPEVQRYWAVGYPKEKGSCVLMSIRPNNQDIRAWKNENCARSLKYVCTLPQKKLPTALRYKIISEKMSWADASFKCSAFGHSATLAIILSEAENIAVIEFIKNEIEKSALNCEHFWIGARRQDYSCQKPFVWQIQHGQEILMKYSAWSPIQPDCGDGIEACVHFRKYFDYTWNDQPCNDMLCAVCELHHLD